MASESDRTPLEYVPRCFASDIKRLMAESPDGVVGLFVQSVNADAPIRLRLLCRMESYWPSGFCPCKSEQFQPIQS